MAASAVRVKRWSAICMRKVRPAPYRLLMAASGDGNTVMALRHGGSCRQCGTVLAAGAPAVTHRWLRTVRCVECARDEQGREEHLRRRHPILGGLHPAVADDPRRLVGWNTRPRGDEVGSRLDAVASPTVRVLHARRAPGGRLTVDHLVVCPGGVVVVDARRESGRPYLRVEGRLFRGGTERLRVGSRDCTELVDDVLRRVEAVRASFLEGGASVAVPPVRGVLCFLDADWPLAGGALTTREVSVLWPRKLAGVVTAPGPMGEAQVAEAHVRLAAAFPPA